MLVKGVKKGWNKLLLGFGGIYHALLGPETLEESFPFLILLGWDLMCFYTLAM